MRISVIYFYSVLTVVHYNHEFCTHCQYKVEKKFTIDKTMAARSSLITKERLHFPAKGGAQGEQ